MARQLTIADQHSSHEPKQKIVLTMEGGSPWYKNIWINDRLYAVYLSDATGKITVEQDR